jgi:hypothetical protein
MNPASPTFQAALKRPTSVLRRGVFIGHGLRVAALGGLCLLVFGLSDFVLGWESPARQKWVLGFALLIGGGLLWALLRSVSLSPQVIARRADAAAANERREIETALELMAARPAENENAGVNSLHNWLAAQAIIRALGHLEKLPVNALWPRRQVKGGLLWLLVMAALLIGAIAVHPRAASRIVTRLIHPSTDLPPYSPYDFVLTPSPARVVYGREISLTASITGPAFTEEVRLLTRTAEKGAFTVLPTFRESASRFARKLEGVTQPVEFAFALGRARSAWTPLEIQYEPQLEHAEVEVKPPVYAGQRATRFTLGSEDLRGLRGAQVRLQVTSNRPLGGGTLEGRAPQGREVIARVVGARPASDATQEMVFDWRIQADLVWTLDLEDVRGGHMAEKVLIPQRLIPDEKPKLELLSPGPMVLATPGSEVSLAWDVDDDLGLDKVEIIRSADGFRDRTLPMPEGAGEKRAHIERQVKLASLGVSEGQTLEFLLEARDRNPSLMGVGTSTAAKIKIISEADYAEQLRERTTLEEFVERYAALREQLAAAQKALEKVSEAAKSGDLKKLETARAEAAKTQREAARWFDAFAREFPAYATDKQLSELAGGLKEELENNVADLEQNADWSDPAKAENLAKQLRDRLQPGAEKLANQEKNALELAKVGAVMEMATDLNAARDEQREVSEALTRLAEELALGETRNRHKLPELRERQKSNQERITKVQKQLPARLDQLPPGYEKFAQGARHVLDQLDLLQVSKQMGDSVAKAGAGKLTGAAADSVLARANLDQILGDPDDEFCKACQGGQPGFCQGNGTAQQTLAQMLAALNARSQGGRQGESAGTGGSGFGALGGSGVTMAGMQLQIPLLGPPRVNLRHSPQGPGKGRRMGESSDGAATTAQAKTAAQSDLPSSTAPKSSGKSWKPEDVPPKYRDAVKNYFTPPPAK